MRLYVNGVQEGSTAQTGVLNTPNRNLYASVEFDAGVAVSRLSGALDELRVYGRALSAAEVQDLYASNTPVVFSTFTGACPESAKGRRRQPRQEGRIGADDGRTLP